MKNPYFSETKKSRGALPNLLVWVLTYKYPTHSHQEIRTPTKTRLTGCIELIKRERGKQKKCDINSTNHAWPYWREKKNWGISSRQLERLAPQAQTTAFRHNPPFLQNKIKYLLLDHQHFLHTFTAPTTTTNHFHNSRLVQTVLVLLGFQTILFVVIHLLTSEWGK